jgi:hypothetical protein
LFCSVKEGWSILLRDDFVGALSSEVQRPFAEGVSARVRTEGSSPPSDKKWWQGCTAGSWICDGSIRPPIGAPELPYCQLTLQEREIISQMYFSDVCLTAIGRRLGRSPSTISCELRRGVYLVVSVQHRAECRRRERRVSCRMDSTAINSAVREELSQHWSPVAVPPAARPVFGW